MGKGIDVTSDRNSFPDHEHAIRETTLTIFELVSFALIKVLKIDAHHFAVIEFLQPNSNIVKNLRQTFFAEPGD